MAINNYGSLKTKLSRYMFQQRFAPDYDDATIQFENAANRRLRVRQMEAVVRLTTTLGEVALPVDYLVWRTVRPTFATSSPVTPIFRPPFAEIDYVHPAYLPPVGRGFDRLFTIEGNLFKTRPVDDRPDAYEFHYYQQIPTITTGDNASNWLLAAYSDVYLFGVLTELFAQMRNLDGAQLWKARRDEVLAEIIQLSALTTGATSPTVRSAEYF
jgi:hypothetical protein